MLKQCVSINEEGRRAQGALVPVAPQETAIDPDLRARIERMAAASGLPVPKIIPGAAVTLLPLTLPMASAKARRAAAGFAFEAHLASPLYAVEVRVGPQLSGGDWLCAATDAAHTAGDRPIIPDLCAVPLPEQEGAWALWWGQDTAYVRFADGGGLCMDKNAFHDLWHAFGRPRIMLYFGTRPPHIPATIVALPELDPCIMQLDLRASTGAVPASWVRRLGFAAALGFATAFAHGALILKDADVLGRLADERSETVARLLQARGLPGTFAEPLPVLIERIARQSTQQSADPFLDLLSQLAAGLEDARIEFRTLRYDAEQGHLTLQALARDLPTLQAAEDRLLQSGLGVQSGSAAKSSSGAELQLIVSPL